MSQTESTEQAVLLVGLYQRPDGQIEVPLTISYRYPNPLWRIPGGGANPKETPEEAAKREYLEEVGLSIKGLWRHKTIKKRSHSERYQHHLQHVLVAEIPTMDGFLKGVQDGEERLTNRLFTLEELRGTLYASNHVAGREILHSHAAVLDEVLRKLFD